MNAREQMRSRRQSQLCFDLGDTVLEILERQGISDLLMLEDGTLWVNERGNWQTVPMETFDEHRRESIIGQVAHALRQEATFIHPNIEGELEIDQRRYRFTGLLPPIVMAPMIAIRKPAEVIYTLDDYEAAKIVTKRQRDIMERAVIDRENIIVAGGLGSGKTTLANALIDVIPHHERVATVEDTFELTVKLPNKTQLHTSSSMDLRVLVRSAMRLQVDRLIVGEVRGAEALEMLKAWNVGAPGGVATIHSNSAGATLVRLSNLILEANVPEQKLLIAETVNLIIYIEAQRINGKLERRVTEMMRVQGLGENGDYIIHNA